MKTIGLIGGMSWESSLEYYRIINMAVKNKLGGLHSAKCVLYSVDFETIEKLQHQGNWEELTKIMIESAQKLESAGVDMIVICTNTMHKMAENLEKHINIPLLHIADATALKIRDYGLKKVGLLGTKFTMEQDFYKKRLEDNYNLEVIVPDTEERQLIHNIIYNELCVGIIKESSKKIYIKIIDHLEKKGAKGVILGCTEIPLLIKQSDVKIPLFDTTKIHAEFAVDFSIK